MSRQSISIPSNSIQRGFAPVRAVAATGKTIAGKDALPFARYRRAEHSFAGLDCCSRALPATFAEEVDGGENSDATFSRLHFQF